MFSSLGLFKAVQCPNGSDCSLLNCFFSHEAVKADAEDQTTLNALAMTDKRSMSRPCESTIQPPLKKRRANESSTNQQQASLQVTHNDHEDTATAKLTPRKVATPIASEEVASRSAGGSVYSAPTNGKPKQPASAKRPISPPVIGANRDVTAASPSSDIHPKDVKVEKLVPRSVAKNPIAFPQRLSILQKLHKQISDANGRLASSDRGKSSKLTVQQLIIQALNEEQSAANKNSSVDGYKNAIAGRLTRYKKMTQTQWQEMVDQEWRKTESKPPTQSSESSNEPPVSGICPNLELAVLKNLSVSAAGLEAYGYVSAQPSEEVIKQCKSSIRSSANWEACDRCGTRFQVFPDRNSEGQLTTRGTCTYHWARPQYLRGGGGVSHPCCNGSGGSEGCTEASTHVFKASDTARLAALLQFEHTPETKDGQQRTSALTFDCEMAYTTYGMELVRVTAVAFPSNKSLLDILVRPFGVILDFNTRFSGVNAEDFRQSIVHGSNPAPDEDVSEDRELQDEPMRVVESPAAARKLLFDLISPKTVLIGHAIENDLNACRIIHPGIVDTALLFPHPKGLPIKFKLRDLAAKYLRRTIQAGGADGHDSKEDSIATADLVKVKIKEKWQSMRLSGWKWHNGDLIGPIAHL